MLKKNQEYKEAREKTESFILMATYQIQRIDTDNPRLNVNIELQHKLIKSVISKSTNITLANIPPINLTQNHILTNMSYNSNNNDYKYITELDHWD